MIKLYVASSWRNPDQPVVVATLRAFGYIVCDFRNPKPGDKGFAWEEVGLERDERGLCRAPALRRALMHPRAVEGFRSDYTAMQEADACVLVLPCGRSAHLEAGWMAGAGKPTFVLAPEIPIDPELMYGVLGRLCLNHAELVNAIDGTFPGGTK